MSSDQNHGSEPVPPFVAIVQPGDSILLCFHETDMDAETLDRARDFLGERFPGVKWGFVEGVAGAVINPKGANQ